MFLLSLVVYFASVEFLLFFAVVFSLHWILPHRFRNKFLLLGSYAFYCCWDYRFLPLVLSSTLVDYYSAIGMERAPHRRKLFMAASVAVNLGQLCVFKYGGFFVEQSYSMLGILGIPLSAPAMPAWVLPLGISFYTFQSLSYTMDVYRRKLAAVRDLPTFSLYVAFFPQLIAGPIERANHLLPQLLQRKYFREIAWQEGAYLFAIGFFKKRVIADSLELLSTQVFIDHRQQGVGILLGLVGATIQTYCDISGYTDMARGIARFFGIQLTTNFNFPHFAKDPVDFWKRWHISLSQWIRHYVHTPLITRFRHPIWAIYIVFILMGIWHGPQLKFIEWGLYWATVSALYQTVGKRYLALKFPFLQQDWVAHLLMPVVIVLGQSFCRSQGFLDFVSLLQSMCTHWRFADFLNAEFFKAYVCIGAVLAFDTFLFYKNDELFFAKRGFYTQAVFYVTLFFLYRNIGTAALVDFIYFHF